MTTLAEIVVPTLKRPQHLRRCLDSICLQTKTVTRVFVGVRRDDDISREVIKHFESKLEVIEVEARGIGVVGSMNSCLARCSADFVGLVDDDVELPNHWIEEMIRHLSRDSVLVGAGGRDLLMDHPELRRQEPLTIDVGTIYWYGRLTGNHHRGGGLPRTVDVLRGSNCLYRGSFLRTIGFEKGLAGKGAQVNWELAIALQARQVGYKLLYDPTVKVVHHVAPRHDDDLVHRGVLDTNGVIDIAHNETLVLLKHGRGFTRITMLLWQCIVGSKTCPGILRLLENAVAHRTNFLQVFFATVKGRLKAIATWWSNTQHAG